jgi:hypothetical protein
MTPLPKLWFSRFVILESYKPQLKMIRDVTLRPGLNIVWATESTEAITGAEQVAPIKHAGHGVGKTTFCLMLRALLGDDGKSVKAILDKLAKHFLDGAVAAELNICGQRYAVCRPFNGLGWAVEGADVEGLFATESKLRFSRFVSEIEAKLLSDLTIKAIPGTEQAITWDLVLSWLTRDQGARLRHFFDWRSDEGTGLRNPKQSRSLLMRIVTGLLTDAESKAQSELDAAEESLKRAKLALTAAETEANSVKTMLVSRLRTWAGVSKTLQMDSDDLFEDSVRKVISRTTLRFESERQKLSEERIATEAKIIDLEVSVRQRDQDLELPEIELAQLTARSQGNQKRVEELDIDRIDKLKQKQNSGVCETVGIPFSNCQHLKDAISAGPTIPEIRDAKQIKADLPKLQQQIKRLDDSLAPRRAQRQRWKEQIETSRESLVANSTNLTAQDKRLGTGEELVRELELWSRERAKTTTSELPPKVAAAFDSLKSAEATVSSAQAAVALANSKSPERREQLQVHFNELAQHFGIQGQLKDSEIDRPFALVGANGEAFSVLEILLGDAACMTDHHHENHHPRFAILDCAREADMSLSVYQPWIAMLADKRFEDCQIILTTTSSPPAALQTEPICVLKLNQLSEDGLLLKALV